MYYGYYPIISPITSQDASELKAQKMTHEEFQRNIISRHDFANLVKYVVANQPEWTDRQRVNEVEVTNAYKKLISEYFAVATSS